jgi:hypothetical protein
MPEVDISSLAPALFASRPLSTRVRFDITSSLKMTGIDIYMRQMSILGVPERSANLLSTSQERFDTGYQRRARPGSDGYR